MPNLTSVEASYNLLHSLPSVLNSLVARRVLNVSNNPMTTVSCTTAQAFLCGEGFMSKSYSEAQWPRQTRNQSSNGFDLVRTRAAQFTGGDADSESYAYQYDYSSCRTGRPPKRIMSSTGRAFEAHIKKLPVLSAEDRVRLGRWSYLV